MLFKLVVLVFFSTVSYAEHLDPDSVIPYVTQESMGYTDTLFGKKYNYSESDVRMINLVIQHIENAKDHTVDTDLFAYGVSAATCEEGFEILAPTVKSADLSGLDAANWATESPATIYEAIGRMAALLKTLNANTAIP